MSTILAPQTKSNSTRDRIFKYGKPQKQELAQPGKAATPKPNSDPNPDLELDQKYYPILFHTAFVPKVGITGALFLSQAWYWHDKPSASPLKGWFWHSHKEWIAETQLTEKELRSARKRVRKAGLIRWKLKGLRPKMYYQVVESRVLELLATEKHETPRKINGPARSAKRADPDRPKGQIRTDITGKNDSDRLSAVSLRESPKAAVIGVNNGSTPSTKRPFTDSEFQAYVSALADYESDPRFRNSKCQDGFLKFNDRRDWIMGGRPICKWKIAYKNWVLEWRDFRNKRKPKPETQEENDHSDCENNTPEKIPKVVDSPERDKFYRQVAKNKARDQREKLKSGGEL